MILLVVADDSIRKMVGHAGQEEARRLRVHKHQLVKLGHPRDRSNQGSELVLTLFLVAHHLLAV